MLQVTERGLRRPTAKQPCMRHHVAANMLQRSIKGQASGRARTLGLCCEILDEIGYFENAFDLAPDIMNILQMAGQSETLPTITALKAICLKRFTKRQTIPATS